MTIRTLVNMRPGEYDKRLMGKEGKMIEQKALAPIELAMLVDIEDQKMKEADKTVGKGLTTDAMLALIEKNTYLIIAGLYNGTPDDIKVQETLIRARIAAWKEDVEGSSAG